MDSSNSSKAIVTTNRDRRVRRAMLTVVFAASAFAVVTLAFRQLNSSLWRRAIADANSQAGDDGRNLFLQTGQDALRRMQNPVYPYSVVAGGVKDAQDLKRAALHDPVVGVHYAGFDYNHARVEQLTVARVAYVSYRIGNRVYWTRHKITLKKGEKVITDGKITARARCANRVEEAPQVMFSPSEPPANLFDQPIQPALGSATQKPASPLASAIAGGSEGPQGPVGLSPVGGGGTFIPILPIIPPPGGGGGGCGTKDNPCVHVGGETPEPSTWLLLGTGLALIAWRSRFILRKR